MLCEFKVLYCKDRKVLWNGYPGKDFSGILEAPGLGMLVGIVVGGRPLQRRAATKATKQSPQTYLQLSYPPFSLSFNPHHSLLHTRNQYLTPLPPASEGFCSDLRTPPLLPLTLSHTLAHTHTRTHSRTHTHTHTLHIFLMPQLARCHDSHCHPPLHSPVRVSSPPLSPPLYHYTIVVSSAFWELSLASSVPLLSPFPFLSARCAVKARLSWTREGRKGGVRKLFLCSLLHLREERQRDTGSLCLVR